MRELPTYLRNQGSAPVPPPPGATRLPDDHRLWQLVFGPLALPHASQHRLAILARWTRHPLAFYPTDFPWLIVQLVGGPCGVIAALQAHIVLDLVLGPDAAAGQPVAAAAGQPAAAAAAGHPAAAAAGQPAAAQSAAGQRLAAAEPAQVYQALARAITRVIWQCRPDDASPARVAWVDVADVEATLEGGEIATLSDLKCPIGVSAHHPYPWGVTSAAFNSPQDLYDFVTRQIPVVFCGPRIPGLLNVLLSCVVTRSIEGCMEDFDILSSEDTSLIEPEQGYCTQELINLLLVGRATSNTFDREKILDSNLHLKGVPWRPVIGHLSEMEALGYSVVGGFYKKPLMPVWTIGRESHYTVALYTDYNGYKMSLHELIMEFLEWRWADGIDPEGSGLVGEPVIAQYLVSENVPRAAQVARELERGTDLNGYVLKERFIQWAIANWDQIPALCEYLSTDEAAFRLKAFDDAAENETWLYFDGQLSNLSDCVAGTAHPKPAAVWLLRSHNGEDTSRGLKPILGATHNLDRSVLYF